MLPGQGGRIALATAQVLLDIGKNVDGYVHHSPCR